MKRKFRIVLLAILTLLCLCFGLTACNGLSNRGQADDDKQSEQNSAYIDPDATNPDDSESDETNSDGAEESDSSLMTSIRPHAYTAEMFSAYIMPDTVKSIGEHAFSACSRMIYIVIGAGVTTIGDSAFYLCRHLQEVYYKGTAQDWNKITIGADNFALTCAKRYYYSEKPNYDGKHWHFDDEGHPVVWERN